MLLALPHGRSAALAAQLPESAVVVDLGADHRLTDAQQWARYYDGEHAEPWAYGVPELPGQRAQLTGNPRIACGGCHATAVELALAPLLAARLIEPEDLAVVSVTGTTGAGRTTKPDFTSAQVMGDVAAYKVGRHQHSAEIVQALSAAAGRALESRSSRRLEMVGPQVVAGSSGSPTTNSSAARTSASTTSS